MKYTKDEYLRLGRTLQKSISENLSSDVIKYTTVAAKFCNEKYRVLYEIEKCYDSNAFEMETIIHEIHEFDSYDEMLSYMNSIGSSIDDLGSAKGLKIPF
ncbi:hypothetical protein [Serratia fonticola]|uniref:hypothetical protein n=1 Tax=Serratia fonticola TaxID=47917 RepID=UPI0021BD495C|nr:hypothetical protein [Serratia fonticola]